MHRLSLIKLRQIFFWDHRNTFVWDIRWLLVLNQTEWGVRVLLSRMASPWQDRLFHLLFRGQPAPSKGSCKRRKPVTLKSGKKRLSNWKCHCISSKSPRPLLFGVASPEAWGRRELCDCQENDSKFNFSIPSSFCLSSPAVPACTPPSPFLKSTACLPCTHAKHTTISQSIHWTDLRP